MVETSRFLELFPAFRKADPALGAEIVVSASPGRLAAGTRVYFEGDDCGQIAFLLAGEIRVFKAGESGREITLYEIGPGETCILNASCILSGKRYPANAETLSDCELLLLPAGRFRFLVDRYSDMRADVFAVLSERMAGVMALVEEIVFRKLDERLMDHLVEKAADGELSTTHQAIANELGTSREVVSRLLKDFERRGRLSLGRHRITLREG